jgi:hypothetical protein
MGQMFKDKNKPYHTNDPEGIAYFPNFSREVNIWISDDEII